MSGAKSVYDKRTILLQVTKVKKFNSTGPIVSSGLYYKNITIVNDVPRVVSE